MRIRGVEGVYGNRVRTLRVRGSLVLAHFSCFFCSPRKVIHSPLGQHFFFFTSHASLRDCVTQTPRRPFLSFFSLSHLSQLEERHGFLLVGASVSHGDEVLPRRAGHHVFRSAASPTRAPPTLAAFTIHSCLSSRPPPLPHPQHTEEEEGEGLS